MRVLVVEDAPLDRKLILEHLGTHGCEAVETTTVRDAVSALQAPGHFDLVVLDVRLSNGTGFDLLVEMEKMRNDVPVIITSAAPEYRDLLPARPFTYWLDKPFHFGRFLEVVDRAVTTGKSLATMRQSVGRLSQWLDRWGG